MFNPFKVQLTCYSSISTEEQEKFLEFLESHLLTIGCDSAWREAAGVHFSSNFFNSHGKYHIMAGVDGGVVFFTPANRLAYEYRFTTNGVSMLVLAAFILLVLGLNPSISINDTLAIVGAVFFFTGIDWALIRYEQVKFMQQLEAEYQRMK